MASQVFFDFTLQRSVSFFRTLLFSEENIEKDTKIPRRRVGKRL
jgi:hypothetical protein